MGARFLTLIFLSLFFASCLPEQSARTLSSTDNSVTSDNEDEDEVDSGDYVSPYWYDAGNKLSTLSIDYNNTKNHYIFGSDINTELNVSANFNTHYCVYVEFETGSKTSYPLMVKATPATTINYSTGKRSRYLRVNLSTESGNQSACNTVWKSNTDSSTGTSSFTSLVYKPQSVCPTCLNIISSKTLEIFKYTSENSATPYLLKVSTDEGPYSNLAMRIDMNGNTSGGGSSCTDAGCSAEGYDCCVNGQCVNEGNVKSSAIQSDPNGFALAELEKATNPNWYLKYPEYYYICLEDPQNGDDDEVLDPEDPEGDAAARLAAMIADYECIEELQANSVEDPFHPDPIDETLPASSYTKCEISDSSQDMYYEQVMKRLYSNCGCSETSNLTTMVSDCPKYTYKLVYEEDALGNPTSEVKSVACVTPANHDNDLPFSDLEVLVNSRSAPHRFFNDDGVELNPYEPATITGSTDQEGEPFQYLDEDNLFPLNGSFNMNSIIGQMNVSLTKARPAKKVDLEFDKIYYIAALEGTYSACPSCAKDSWFSNFSPYPTTNQGHGIRAAGFTTSRDSWGSNSTFANYEDAIFGRACWVPPTMVPFGHSEKTDSQDQRLARLSSQAAMYVNGYQRDWFGFNRGALIGSFDGVTWFAIGKGRKVRATSDRLYLAINAPFADLASPTDHVVSVQEYDFITTAASYDYHPDEEINSPYQNDGGLCQQWHECETDSHCISKLGWEYSCVDVTQYRTKWPNFNPTGAEEIASDAKTGAIAQFLQQGELVPGTSTKKCVYRGAGAPCRIDIENVSDEGKRRALACAPNFYCASLNSSDFNKEVARFGAPLESIMDSKNHYYGQDANMLGRPKDYVITTGGSVLPNDVKSAITENVALTDSAASAAVGLCRPAKSLPSKTGLTGTQNYDQLDQHMSKDSGFRTDFISQISGCNSALYTSMRYASCPMIGSDGNYLHLSDSYINVDSSNTVAVPDLFNNWVMSSREDLIKYHSTQQNMCGLEAIDKNVFDITTLNEEQLRTKSAFKSIEARSLASSDVQVEPTLAQNACFRRAGSVCHTNYDCSPNYKHYEVIDLLHPDVFGNSAERKFWEEYLVCGQGQAEPVLTTDPSESQLAAYNEYTMHNNRCCREVGKELTMFTEDSPNSADSVNLRTDVYGGFQPNNPNRYSRYISSLPQVDDSTLEGKDGGSTYPSRISAKTPVDATYSSGDPSILDGNQWKTIHDTAARTCCGGSWVRKFADGTNDWSRNRLNLNVDNFKCLNYKTPLMLTENPEDYYTVEAELSKDRINFCADSDLGASGCAQYSMEGIDDFITKRPKLNNTGSVMRIDTDPEVMNDLWASNEWSFMQMLSYDSFGTLAPYMDWSVAMDDIENDKAGRKVIFTRIPTFIAFDDINDIRIDLEDPDDSNGDGKFLNDATTGSCTRITNPANGYNCGTPNSWQGVCDYWDFTWIDPVAGGNNPGDDACYYMYDEDTRRLKVTYRQDILDDANNYEKKSNSLIIEFKAPGTLAWEMDSGNIPNGTAVNDDTYLSHRRSSTPGNALFYLEKLARLELIGIPQMTYEPVFCNDIYQKMVPGIFKDSIKTANDFITNSSTFTDTRPGVETYWDYEDVADYNPSDAWTSDERKKIADQTLLDHEAIFADNEFKCCLPLGSTIDSTSQSASMCCSGAVREVESGDASDTNLTNNETIYKCALPTGTDLNVYFNKFVSGEGIDDEYLGGAQPLDLQSDFDEYTGAPKTSSEVLSKLSAIGEAICSEGSVTRGGFFGPFDPEPVAQYEPSGGSPSPINSVVDSIYDNGTINNRVVGYDQFQQGYRWNHHVYCAPESN